MKGYLIYREIAVMLNLLKQEDAGAVIQAANNRFLYDREPEGLTENQQIVYDQIVERLERDEVKYQKKVDRMDKNSKHKKNEIDNDIDIEIDNDIDNDIDNEIEDDINGKLKLKPKLKLNTTLTGSKTHSVSKADRVCDSTELEFESLWKDYPKKQGKRDALKAYQKARKEGTTEEEVRAGLASYVDYIRRNRIQDRYIKYGSSWFNQQAWTDDYSEYRNREGTTNDFLETDEYRDFLGEMGALIRGGKA